MSSRGIEERSDGEKQATLVPAEAYFLSYSDTERVSPRFPVGSRTAIT